MSIEFPRFTLRFWDWLLLAILCAPSALLIAADVGTPFEAILGEATVYFGVMACMAYAAGKGRWQKSGRRSGAGRWMFRLVVVALAAVSFVVAIFSAMGPSAARAGTAHMAETTKALRVVLDSHSDMEVLRAEFRRVAHQQLEAAITGPSYDRPLRTVGAELAIDTLRPQVEMAEAIAALGASSPLSSDSFATKEGRATILGRARAVLDAGESAKISFETLEARAKKALERQPVPKSAIHAFLHPLRRRPEHPPISPGDPTINRWARSIIALYEHLDQTADTWTIEKDGTLRTAVGESAEVMRLVAAVEASLRAITEQAESPSNNGT